MRSSRRRWRYLAIICGCAFSAISCVLPFRASLRIKEKVRVDNLLAIYMAASNDLETEGLADIAETLSAFDQAEYDGVVVLLFDRIQNGGDGFFDWDDTRLYRIDRQEGRAVMTELDSEELGLSAEYIDEELDMGDGRTLAYFLRFIDNNYSIGRFYLDIWNHGGGWISPPAADASRAIAYDDESDDSISLKELSTALDSGGLYCDMILTDACSMALLETSAACRGRTRTIVFSQMAVPGAGFPYHKLIPILFSPLSLEEQGTAITAMYADHYADETVSLSAFRVDLENGLNATLETIAGMFPDPLSAAIRSARDAATEYASTAVDLAVLFPDRNELAAVLSPSLIAVYPKTLSGISVFFPLYFDYCPLSAYYNRDNVTLLSALPLAEFHKAYNHSGKINIDTCEPNGTKSRAVGIRTGETIRSFIWCRDDKDWYTIPIAASVAIEINLEPPPYSDFDLKAIWSKNGQTYTRISNALAGDESISLSATDTETAGKIDILVYPALGIFNQDHPYVLTTSVRYGE